MSETPEETPEEEEPTTEEEPTEEEEEQESGPSESQLAAEQAAEEQERFTKEYEAANKAHRRRLEKLIGQDLGDSICEVCNGVGFKAPGTVEEIPLERKLDAQECPVCKGYGQLLTPSKVEGHMLATCNNCAGAGWVAAAAPSNVTQLPPPVPQAAEQPMTGQFVPGKGFQPFGSDEWIPVAPVTA